MKRLLMKKDLKPLIMAEQKFKFIEKTTQIQILH